MIKALKLLHIVQQIGKRRRLVWYNPLSYLFLAIFIAGYFIGYGLKGIKEDVFVKNPFKWQ